MAVAICPADEQELADCLAECGTRKHSVEVIGGGSRRCVNGCVEADFVLDVSRMSGVIDYDPVELVLTARAGTPLDEIESLVRDCRQMMAFEPPAMYRLTQNCGATPTLGGAIAANSAGPRRIASGAARDHFLGFRAVSGRGEAFKGGGKVVKNVTGFDLAKLLAGSWGSLAVLTEVSIKTMPRPRVGMTLAIAGLQAASACTAIALSLTLPCAVSAAAFLPEAAARRSPVAAKTSLTLFRLEGFAASVAAHEDTLRTALEESGTVVRLPDDLHAATWLAVAEVASLLPSDEPVWRLAVPASEAATVTEQLDAGRWIIDWGGGLIWYCGTRPPVHRSLAHVQRWRGKQGTDAQLWAGLPAAKAAIMQSLKTKFDPCNILNPGRFLPNITMAATSDANPVH